MQRMFAVRSRPQNAASSRSHLPAPVGRPCPMPYRLAPAPKPRPRTSHSIHPPFDSRQGALQFNQPLTFDTSSVTHMEDMFEVRFARSTPPPPAPPEAMSPALPVHLPHLAPRCEHALIRPCGPQPSPLISCHLNEQHMLLLCAALYIAPTAHSRLRPAPRPRSYIALLLTRQTAKAFNQQLSFDTSQVIDMEAMFSVRSTRARPQKRSLESPTHPPACGPTPVPTPSHVLSRLPHRHHTASSFGEGSLLRNELQYPAMGYAPHSFDSAGSGGV